MCIWTLPGNWKNKNMKMTVIPNVIGAVGKGLEIRTRVETIQTTALL